MYELVTINIEKQVKILMNTRRIMLFLVKLLWRHCLTRTQPNSLVMSEL